MKETEKEKPQFQQAKFLTSVAELKQLPPDKGCEVAFIGRSNAGKSSALNTITGIKNLARVSKTPGRTQMINFFSLDEQCCCRLVDLPGYGYAKVPKIIQERWAQTIDVYLQNRECLRGLILVMDIRHPMKEIDQHVIAWTVSCGIPVHILLTKTDKLSTAAARKVLKEVEEQLKKYKDKVTLQLYSSLDRTGTEEAQTKISEWFCQQTGTK